jgi:glucosylceramidase
MSAPPASPLPPRTARHGRRIAGLAAGAALLLVGTLIVLPAQAASAAAEPVNIWLTTTNDSGGRNVTRGLQQQSPIAFAATSAGANQTITVNENTRFQQFIGAGASFTDTAAWLMNSSGALSAGTRSSVMTSLFSPTAGIGLDFLRNPMGASDLARSNYTYDSTCCDLNDFSISHDLADVLPLTKQAQALNPALKIMAVPWTAPPWMKDNNAYSQGFLQAQYYGLYAQYFVKYIQAYQAQGVHIDYVSPQNEPTCCAGYPSMQWNASGLDFFVASNLLPALHAAGLTTKVLIHDWNWDGYSTWAAPLLNDAAIRNDSLFGGIAWHGYSGDVGQQTTVHNLFPAVDAFDTEHSGGTWIANQQNEDMNNLISYTRNWGRTVTKWSLAVDQAMGPHNGGCGTCTGIITVHNGDSRSGQVDNTVEYYTTGHLTKFVKPGAFRIDSSANGTVPNVAWRNPDGSKALVAYNGTGGTQSVKVVWGNESFTYNLPAATSATFTWTGTQGTGGTGGGGAITGFGGKCVDVAGGGSANGTAVQLWTCNGSTAQQWTVGTDGTVRALGKCMDVTGAGTANGTKIQLYDCNGTSAQSWSRSGTQLINTGSGRCLDATGPSSADGTRLQIWDCSGGANQQWNV